MKKPLIFLEALSQSQLEHLGSLSGYGNLKEFSQYTQLYTHTDGSLEVAYSSAVHKVEEVKCNNYQEFITKWEQYKLWLILQNTQ